MRELLSCLNTFFRLTPYRANADLFARNLYCRTGSDFSASPPLELSPMFMFEVPWPEKGLFFRSAIWGGYVFSIVPPAFNALSGFPVFQDSSLGARH